MNAPTNEPRPTSVDVDTPHSFRAPLNSWWVRVILMGRNHDDDTRSRGTSCTQCVVRAKGGYCERLRVQPIHRLKCNWPTTTTGMISVVRRIRNPGSSMVGHLYPGRIRRHVERKWYGVVGCLRLADLEKIRGDICSWICQNCRLSRIEFESVNEAALGRRGLSGGDRRCYQ